MSLGIADSAAANGALAGAAAGIAAGAGILTRDGEIPVDWLMAGERVISRDAGLVTLLAVESRLVDGATLVRVRAGALGEGRPGRDLLLGPDQPVLLRDWRARVLCGLPQVQVPVAALVEGEGIAAVAVDGQVRLFTLVFAEPHVVYADGVETFAATPALASTA